MAVKSHTIAKVVFRIVQIMVNKVTFVGFRREIAPVVTPPWIRPWSLQLP